MGAIHGVGLLLVKLPTGRDIIISSKQYNLERTLYLLAIINCCSRHEQNKHKQSEIRESNRLTFEMQRWAING